MEAHTMEKGHYIVGIYLGYKEEPWTKGNGTNRKIGLQTNEYLDDFEQVVKTTTRVDVSPEHSNYYKSHHDELIGKLVMVPVLAKARAGGKEGAWLSLYQPKNTEISVLTPQGKKAA
jgi:hypothetical protein